MIKVDSVFSRFSLDSFALDKYLQLQNKYFATLKFVKIILLSIYPLCFDEKKMQDKKETKNIPGFCDISRKYTFLNQMRLNMSGKKMEKERRCNKVALIGVFILTSFNMADI